MSEPSRRNVEISKFLSFVLRHEPQSIGLTLDSEGWAQVQALIDSAAARGRRLDRAAISEVVRSNDKQRFALSADGERIRAVQGHSAAGVSLTREAIAPPPVLYHGTASRFVGPILEQGLKAGSRHQVHLSADPQTATKVGARHGRPVVLRVEALRMHQRGLPFFRAENGVWLADHVPAEFISLQP